MSRRSGEPAEIIGIQTIFLGQVSLSDILNRCDPHRNAVILGRGAASARGPSTPQRRKFCQVSAVLDSRSRLGRASGMTVLEWVTNVRLTVEQQSIRPRSISRPD